MFAFCRPSETPTRMGGSSPHVPLSDVHPDFDPCAECGGARYLHRAVPLPGEHEFEPAYLMEWLAA